jgi:hypothetical protein
VGDRVRRSDATAKVMQRERGVRVHTVKSCLRSPLPRLKPILDRAEHIENPRAAPQGTWEEAFN